MPTIQFADRERAEHAEASAPATAPTLVVGHAHDTSEHDADRVADQVIQRLRGMDGAGAGSDHDHSHDHSHDLSHDHSVRRAATGSDDAAVVGVEGGALDAGLTTRIEQQRGGGQSLSGDVRARMEAGFGTDLGSVRVHTGTEAAKLSRSISARAFTTGQDVFFGAGEYRPDTAEGERVLAHEIAHTRQQAGVRRTAIHRLWDFSRPVDYGTLASIGTVSSGQPVFFLTDTSGDQVVVKAEGHQIGGAALAGALLEQAGGSKSVSHAKVSDKGALLGALRDRGKWDRASLAAFGRAKRTTTHFMEKTHWAAYKKQVGDDVAAAMSDEEVGWALLGESLDHYQRMNWMAMSKAGGTRAQEMSREADDDNRGNPMARSESTKFRKLLMNATHNRALGQVSAIDLFMGNGDRVETGNVGNWLYDGMSGVMTLIDHIDDNVDPLLASKTVEHKDLARLAKNRLSETAAALLRGMSQGIKDPHKGNDPGFEQWLDANGGMNRAFIEECLEDGLKAGRERLIKIFSATRFFGKSADRKIKKSLKKVAQAAAETDREDGEAADPNAYYTMLKQRALWLKKN